MNTSSKPHPSFPAVRASQPSDTIADTIDSVKNTVGEAVDRGQAAVTQATTAAGDMVWPEFSSGSWRAAGQPNPAASTQARHLRA
jgi:hypothetical protein